MSVEVMELGSHIFLETLIELCLPCGLFSLSSQMMLNFTEKLSCSVGVSVGLMSLRGQSSIRKSERKKRFRGCVHEFMHCGV